MNLLQLSWKKWRILAVYDSREDCSVLDYLGNIGTNNPRKMRERILGRLRNRVAEHGPEFKNKEKVKHLDSGIYEFREQPSKGPKPRIFFFIDDEIVICTEGISKRGDNINDFIGRAKEIRNEYFAAKANDDIDIESFPGE